MIWMSKEELEIPKYLKRIDEKLETIINLLKRSAPAPKISDEERKILLLCNSKNSMDDMMKKTKKTKTNIAFLLSSLRSKGLIKSVTVKNKLVYTYL